MRIKAQLVNKEFIHLTEEGKKLGVFEKKPAEEETNCVSRDENLKSFLVVTEDREEEEFCTLESQPLKISKRNCNARMAAEEFYRTSWGRKFSSFHGTNNSAVAVMKHLPSEEDSLYLFPQNCCFHCCDVRDIITHVKGQFDLVVLDPPWWNKFIRRKNAKCVEAGD
ncbi:hypothetical protein J437_LFUL015242 [Ladona fulva]|uniref:Methyltransferase-like protein 4 n=1 Tax=Ladona fulva TaxID=123851 RepID=A0A8K0P7N8_LADFU|nr:hypothetical protein J437_LFUL015242 [Ladona fulva]